MALHFSRLATLSILVVAGGLASCATISESECQAGNWADLGYRDGVNGASRSLIADYANTCSKYGADIDRQTYLTSYEAGLVQYCVPDNGYNIGRQGSSYNNVCGAPEFEGFRIAYADGRQQYDLEREHERLLSQLKDTEDQIDDVRRRLRDPETPEEEYDRLVKKRDRLEDDRSDQRRALLSFERANGVGNGY